MIESTAPDTVNAARFDWPGDGPIDLAVHDRPHASAAMEWWYVHAHVSAADGRPFAVFAAFFRVDTRARDATVSAYSHYLAWGIVDLQQTRFHPHTLLEPSLPAIALRDFDDHAHVDPLAWRALREVLVEGRVPSPDRLGARDAWVRLDVLDIDLDGNRFWKRPDGSYELELADASGRQGCWLILEPRKPVARHGDNGVVKGLGQGAMFYYFVPRCRVRGSVTVEGASIDVDGDGWYDHEWGEHREPDGAPVPKIAWNWIAVQLDNGCEVTAYELVDRATTTRNEGRWLIAVDPAGRAEAHADFSLVLDRPWGSMKTLNEYPTRGRLIAEHIGLDLDIATTVPGQEVVTLLSPPAFWEGRVEIGGTMNGRPVTGRGFLERSGFNCVDTTDDLLAAVGRETRRAVARLLPAPLTRDAALALFGGAEQAHLADGLDLDRCSRTLVQPIRDMIDRGGKAWRSLGVALCMDAVGGDSQQFADCLAIPELLHVGSLIVDDVEDGSDVRRGGPACHRIHGMPLAVNAGCAAYFLAQAPFRRYDVDASLRARIYEAYFDAVRAAHAGQALDLDSTSLVPRAGGDCRALERQVLAVHRLKSGAPTAAIARMAAAVGGGSDAQIAAIGRLYEAFGLAFQIMDDVLDVRGFAGNWKTGGEDLLRGKVTAPVAAAAVRLGDADRRRLWSILGARPPDPARVPEAAALIEQSGALDACSAHARTLIESAWAEASPLLPDSLAKMRMRAFGWWILDRHY